METRSRRFAGLFEPHILRGLFHLRPKRHGQIPMPTFQEHPHIADCLRIGLVRGQTDYARTQAPVNVVLQARRLVYAAKVYGTRRHLEKPMDEVDQPVRQISRKIRPVIGAAVLSQTARHVYSRILFSGQLDVRVCFVIAQQDVVARLVLLDEIVLERERFFVVVDLDKIDVPRLADQRSGFGVGQPVLVEIASDARAKALRFADIDDFPVRILVQIHAGRGR